MAQKLLGYFSSILVALNSQQMSLLVYSVKLEGDNPANLESDKFKDQLEILLENFLHKHPTDGAKFLSQLAEIYRLNGLLIKIGGFNFETLLTVHCMCYSTIIIVTSDPSTIEEEVSKATATKVLHAAKEILDRKVLGEDCELHTVIRQIAHLCEKLL